MTMTTTLHISLPEPLKEYVKERVEEKQYSNPSDYVRTLIREDQKRREEEQLELERMLLQGIESGKGVPMTKKEWDALRTTVREQVRKRSTAV